MPMSRSELSFTRAEVLGSNNAHVGRRTEPDPQRLSKTRLDDVADPGDVSVGPNEHGAGGRDRADRRKLPRAVVARVERLHAIGPARDAAAARRTEVEQHRPGIVQQLVDPTR